MSVETVARMADVQLDQFLASQLSALDALPAAAVCAHLGGGIPQVRRDTIVNTCRDNHFEDFVPHTAPLVTTKAELQRVPPGALIALISVDRPAAGRQLARTTAAQNVAIAEDAATRRLKHAMVSIGGGWAAASKNFTRIGYGIAAADGWEAIDLADHLHWFPLDQTNRYDVVSLKGPSGAPVGGRLRIRYVDTGPPPPTPPQLPAPDWNHPKPTDYLFYVVGDSALEAPLIYLERKGVLIRPSIRFRLDAATFTEFFNSPDGLRGHYYKNPDLGERYNQWIVQSVADKFDFVGKSINGVVWNPRGYLERSGSDSVIQAGQQDIGVFRKALRAGRLWYADTGIAQPSALPTSADIRRTEWPQPATGSQFAGPDNLRWKDVNVDQNTQDFTRDTQLDIRTATGAKFYEQIIKPAKNSHGDRWYFDWLGLNSRPNMELRGSWVDWAGSLFDQDSTMSANQKFGLHYFGDLAGW